MSEHSRTLRRGYKEVRLQQVRSFVHTARLGSLTAAADALGVAQPTVWKQVHALEREFGAKLVEPSKRGCRLTADGRLLLQIADSLVAGFDSMQRYFQEARARVAVSLAVATTPRILVEDLPECVVAFEDRWPNVHLTFKEMWDEDVTAEVEAGRVDLGLIHAAGSQADNPRLVLEPGYELETVLVTPAGHPLARRRVVRPRDLLPYPLVNAPYSFPYPAVLAAVEKFGLFKTQPRRVEVFSAATIRRYVELGFGIGLLHRPAVLPPDTDLHLRVMSRYFGRGTTYLVWRKGALQSPAARAFAATVTERLSGRQSRPN
jgi:molybdate transport repressor ModE-like protein